jgi:hypothetical protein
MIELRVIKGKAMKLVFLVLLAINVLGCNAIRVANQSPFIEAKLIGVWKGEHTEQSGTIKSWIQTRNADGTYTIEFSFTEPDETTKSFTESGRWWVQDALFYEIALPGMAQPDKYKYSFKEKECIHFVLVESNGLTEGIDAYSFRECLIADSPPASIGSSI